MKTRTIGILTLVVAISTITWGVLFIVGEVISPRVLTLADRINAIESHFGLYLLNYTNAGLLTISCVAMLAGFFVYCRDENPVWAFVALVFIPIYGLSNVVVYLSQVFVVPMLLDLYHQAETTAVVETLLRLTLHTWSGSAAGFVNGLAYAVLGIPSIILGLLMYRKARELKIGGLLLAVSGVLSMIALLGMGIRNDALARMSLVSAVPYLAGLIMLGIGFLRKSSDESNISALQRPFEMR